MLAACGGAGALVLEMLGPSPPGPASQMAEIASGPALTAAPPAAVATAASSVTTAPRPVSSQPADTRGPGAPIPEPQPALLEPAPDFPGKSLPRIGTLPAGGISAPMKAYAGGVDPLDRRPRVALLLAGIGVSGSDSDAAIAHTPAGVTLAYSPYVSAPDLAQARSRGHEIVLSIPMEPAGYPLEDEGPQALLTSSSIEDNARRLEWTLSRHEGYAGATGALGVLHGERFARAGQQMALVMSELAKRGLYYVDPQVGDALTAGAGLAVDILVDDPELAQSIDTNLNALTRVAIDRGSALGLAGAPRPVTVERITAWADQLAVHGVVLVPVSALLAESGAGRAHATR
jgi:polysaccharide deacetylase 2 family uncharacterized protein YibQ